MRLLVPCFVRAAGADAGMPRALSPPQTLAEEARLGGRRASVLRRGELDIRPGQSAAEVLGRLMETAGAEGLREHFRQQLRGGLL